NMLYARSATVRGLGFVVMDEVHYLADRFRGAVWEEVIINLPESVAVVSLSATVSNAEEFGDWLSEVRDSADEGRTLTVVEERRPVPLYQHVLVGRTLYDLFEDASGADGSAPNDGTENRVNRELERLGRRENRAPRGARGYPGRGSRGRGSGRGQRDRGRGRGHRSHGAPRPYRNRTPNRVEVLDRLDADGLLPAIIFIFSRAGCDAAVRQCLHSHLRLTSRAEEREIRAYVDLHCSSIPAEDLHVLGYYEFVEALARGVA